MNSLVFALFLPMYFCAGSSYRITTCNLCSSLYSGLTGKTCLLKGGHQTYHDRLISAVKGGNRVDVEEILKCGGNPNHLDEDGMSAILYAAIHGQLDVFIELVEMGGDLLAKSRDGSTPLHLAAYYGHDELVQYILKRASSVDPNLRDNDGSTPLHNAAYKGQYACASVLLNHGADVSICQVVSTKGCAFLTVVHLLTNTNAG